MPCPGALPSVASRTISRPHGAVPAVALGAIFRERAGAAPGTMWNTGYDVAPSVRVWIGLGLSFVSALVISWAYSREHAAAIQLPKVSISHPVNAVRTLLADRRWMVGFGAEGGGWIVYLVALRLAPLALVQGVNASGVAILAYLSTGGRPSRLTRRERVAVALAVVGLALLALSLIGTNPAERGPRPIPTIIWLAVSLTAAAVFALRWPKFAQASTLGLAAGLLFAGGDTSAKLVVQGGGWVLAAVPLVIFYSLGSIQLQSAFQHGNILVTAGTANLATNAVPIVAGFLLFRQVLPPGIQLTAQAVAFGAIVASAMLLGDRARGVKVTTADAEDAVNPAIRHSC